MIRRRAACMGMSHNNFRKRPVFQSLPLKLLEWVANQKPDSAMKKNFTQGMKKAAMMPKANSGSIL